MENIIIVRRSDIEPGLLPGTLKKEAGCIKRIIYPKHVGESRIVMGIAEANPGFSIHRWHTHTTDKAEGYEVVYSEGFEEIYYIIEGRGVVQWKNQDGEIYEE